MFAAGPVGEGTVLPAMGAPDSVSGSRMAEFFARISPSVTQAQKATKALVVTHVVQGRGLFLEAVERSSPIAMVLSKPKSVHAPTRLRLSHRYDIRALRRDVLHAAGYAVDLVDEVVGNESFVVLDIGGYFAPVVHDLYEHFGSRMAGIVEDTENGLQRYEGLESLPVPVVSVARSPLKVPEDQMVGQSIVFSMESILRAQGVVLPGKSAAVIGYGKVGRSVAQMMHARGLPTRVFDINPICLTEAVASGFEVASSLSQVLEDATFVVCATGNRALRGQDFKYLRNDAFVTSATSADDEFDLSELKNDYRRRRLDNYVTRYSTRGHRFHLLNNGNSVNFLNGTVAGAFIGLVQGEILVAIQNLLAGKVEAGLSEVSIEDRQRIAAVWLELFC